MDIRNDVARELRMGSSVARQRSMLWFFASVFAMALFLIYLLFSSSNGVAINYVTHLVLRGDLQVTVTATGTLEPINQVDVSSELSGTIETVEVDFNDHVRQGQVLARLDTEGLQVGVLEARASLESEEAKLEEAKATVLETRFAFTRCEKLASRQLCSKEALDTAHAKYVRARAVEASAMAQVAVAGATLEGKETELNKASIRSPIDGLVLLRRIEPGQTVAASLRAPVLFTLAKDLAKMALHVAVDEADVGRIDVGQSAEFSVDAYPGRTFPASITQVRYAPRTLGGVVTYETLLAVDNADLLLRPGMTATSVITVKQLHDVVLLPNAALEFSLPEEALTKRGGRGFGSIFSKPLSAGQRINETKKSGHRVWLLGEQGPQDVTVTTGASDGKFSELLSGGLQPGQAVIVDSAVEP